MALSPEQKAVAEKLFRCITEMTEEGNLVRRASELDRIRTGTGVPAETLRDVVAAFEREGFLVVTESGDGRSPLIDISHEAIARQWRRLGSKDPLALGWIVDESRQPLPLVQVERAAQEWGDTAGHRFPVQGLAARERGAAHRRTRGPAQEDADRRFLTASQTRDARRRGMTPKVLVQRSRRSS